MGSLKDQLLKAGLRPTSAPKEQNQRKEAPKKKEVAESVIHQKQRNFCEECQQTYPDVELYHHKNRITDAEWMCVRCADKLKILDTCRQTAQSDFAVKKTFRREYGATLTALEIKNKSAQVSEGRPRGVVANGNRVESGNKGNQGNQINKKKS